MNRFSAIFAAIFAAFAIFFTACGYQPTARLTQSQVGDAVYVEVKTDKQNPQNSVALKDAISNAITLKLRRNLATKAASDTLISAEVKSVSFTAMTYDSRGYITSYKASVQIAYEVRYNGRSQRFTTGGEYDFTPTRETTSFTESSLTDNERYNAILKSSEDSFDDFISRLAISGFVAQNAKNAQK